MAKIVTCVNGHQFDADKSKECPVCPKTVVSKGTSTKPITVGVPTAAGNKTVPLGTAKTTLLTDPFPGETTRVTTDNKTHILQGTKIFRESKEANNEKKLVGVLVSYDLHEQGKLFRLFEGRNLVGSDRNCDIIIENVPAVSGRHLTILYRNATFLFKDEFSTNGTSIDGVMKNEGVLDHNCTITIGGVQLLFIMVPFGLLGV